MAKPGLLVDSGALIALANRREMANQPVSRVLGEYFGDLVVGFGSPMNIGSASEKLADLANRG